MMVNNKQSTIILIWRLERAVETNVFKQKILLIHKNSNYQINSPLDINWSKKHRHSEFKLCEITQLFKIIIIMKINTFVFFFDVCGEDDIWSIHK